MIRLMIIVKCLLGESTDYFITGVRHADMLYVRM